MPSFTLVGGKLNYNDNCVLPIVNVGEAKEEFDKIVNSLVNYINNGGFEKIESITIQGSADSGKPSTSGNDHVEAGYNNPFNGETDLYKMNQFLADERAKKYGLLVSNTVKEATGKDISSKYKYLKGENFYGQSNPEGGRVGERKIDFIVNAPELKVADKVETSSTITPVDENHKSTTIVIIKPDGTTTEKQGIQFITQSGASSKNRVQGFYPNDESLSEIVEIPTGVVEGEIVNGRLLRLNGKDICSFYSNKQHTENNPSYTCKVTGHRGVERDGIILVKDYYFNLRRPRPYS
jgi:hypothetical protein